MISIARDVNIQKEICAASFHVITFHRKVGYDIFLIIESERKHKACLPITSKGWAELASPMETSMLFKNIYGSCQAELWKSTDAYNPKMAFSSVRLYCCDDSDDDNDDLTFYQDTFLLQRKTVVLSNPMEIISIIRDKGQCLKLKQLTRWCTSSVFSN